MTSISRGVPVELWELVARESIRDLMAAYTAATDRFDLAGVAGCFAPTGVLEFTGGAQPLSGPEDIAAGLAAAMSRPAVPAQPAPAFVRHHVSSVRFESLDPHHAEVRSYFAVYTDAGADHWGRYRDEVLTVDGRWLFGRRTITVDAFAPTSLMAR